MIETEVRSLIPKPDIYFDILCNSGFKHVSSSIQEDIIIDYPDGRLFKSGSKIRIRIENEICELTYKGQFQGDARASRRTEINIKINSSETPQIISLFECIGFPVLFKIKKERITYKAKNALVSFDRWPILGWMMEIEADESEIYKYSKLIDPLLDLRNYRLKELFDKVIRNSGKTLNDLVDDYKKSSNYDLGNINLILE